MHFLPITTCGLTYSKQCTQLKHAAGVSLNIKLLVCKGDPETTCKTHKPYHLVCNTKHTHTHTHTHTNTHTHTRTYTHTPNSQTCLEADAQELEKALHGRPEDLDHVTRAVVAVHERRQQAGFDFAPHLYSTVVCEDLRSGVVCVFM